MITLNPIGVVRSEVRDRKSMPSLGIRARVEVFPEYAAGLHRLEKHSHLWVLAWLGEAERNVLKVIPRGVADRSPGGLHGVFAVRSPVRPNPIGLTVAKVLGVQDRTIELERLDFLDGTPVIDLKPYFLSRDLIFSATNVQIGQPADRSALRESLVMQAVNFHGELCAGAALAVRIIEHFRSEVLDMTEPERWGVMAPADRPCLIDALMGMTRATPGRRNLLLDASRSVRFDYRGSIYDYEILETGSDDPAAILDAPDEALFRLR